MKSEIRIYSKLSSPLFYVINTKNVNRPYIAYTGTTEQEAVEKMIQLKKRYKHSEYFIAVVTGIVEQ